MATNAISDDLKKKKHSPVEVGGHVPENKSIDTNANLQNRSNMGIPRIPHMVIVAKVFQILSICIDFYLFPISLYFE